MFFLFVRRRVCAPRRDTTRNRFAPSSLRGALRSFLAPVRGASRLRCSVLGVHPTRVLLAVLVGGAIRPRRPARAHFHRLSGTLRLYPHRCGRAPVWRTKAQRGRGCSVCSGLTKRGLTQRGAPGGSRFFFILFFYSLTGNCSASFDGARPVVARFLPAPLPLFAMALGDCVASCSSSSSTGSGTDGGAAPRPCLVASFRRRSRLSHHLRQHRPRTWRARMQLEGELRRVGASPCAHPALVPRCFRAARGHPGARRAWVWRLRSQASSSRGEGTQRERLKQSQGPRFPLRQNNFFRCYKVAHAKQTGRKKFFCRFGAALDFVFRRKRRRRFPRSVPFLDDGLSAVPIFGGFDCSSPEGRTENQIIASEFGFPSCLPPRRGAGAGLCRCYVVALAFFCCCCFVRRSRRRVFRLALRRARLSRAHSVGARARVARVRRVRGGRGCGCARVRRSVARARVFRRVVRRAARRVARFVRGALRRVRARAGRRGRAALLVSLVGLSPRRRAFFLFLFLFLWRGFRFVGVARVRGGFGRAVFRRAPVRFGGAVRLGFLVARRVRRRGVVLVRAACFPVALLAVAPGLAASGRGAFGAAPRPKKRKKNR